MAGNDYSSLLGCHRPQDYTVIPVEVDTSADPDYLHDSHKSKHPILRLVPTADREG